MDKYESINELTMCFGVMTQIYREDDRLHLFDKGLRSRLFSDYDYQDLTEFLFSMKKDTIYQIKDPFGCYYNSIQIIQGDNIKRIIIIGPWLNHVATETEILQLIEDNSIPSYLEFELREYLRGNPVINNLMVWRNVLVLIARYLLETVEDMIIPYMNIELNERVSDFSYSTQKEATLSIHTIEERYRLENNLIDAIANGDEQQAIQCYYMFSKVPIAYEVDIRHRAKQGYLMMLNTLARKAAEKGFVHPAHINAVSTELIRKIRQEELNTKDIGEEIIRKYCATVRQFSLQGCSHLVRSAINIIDFNLTEHLSLSTLAQKLNINSSYLSWRFKQEKNMTITDYINTKRLQLASDFLKRDNMMIQEAAELSGFTDVNYFSQLFKRYYGETPTQYRAKFIKNNQL